MSQRVCSSSFQPFKAVIATKTFAKNKLVLVLFTFNFVVLYCNFRSLAFLGLLGFLTKAAKSLFFYYPPKCSQVKVIMREAKSEPVPNAVQVRVPSWKVDSREFWLGFLQPAPQRR